MLCNHCGAPVRDGDLSCRYCSTSIASQSSGAQSLAEFLQDFDRQIQAIRTDGPLNEERIIGDRVAGLFVPDERKNLLEFGLFVISKVETTAGSMTSEGNFSLAPELVAWTAKARQVKHKIFLAGETDERTTKLVAMIDNLPSPDLTLTKTNRKALIIIFGVFGGLLAAILLLGFLFEYLD